MAGRYQWTDEATEALLCLWKKKGHEKKRPDYDDITSCMNDMGFQVSKKHCRSRMKNLMYRYKKAASKARVDGHEIKHRHFKQLDVIMGHSEDVVPPLLYHEYDLQVEDGEEEEEEEQDEDEQQGEENNSGGVMEAQPHIVFISEPDQNLHPGQDPSAGQGTHLAESSSYVPQYGTTGTSFPLLLPGESREPLQEMLPTLGGYRGSGVQVEDDCARQVGATKTNPAQQNTLSGNSERQMRTGMDKDFLDFMSLLQEKAEAREDARQQRLLEHERRMEEKRQQWRQKELRHQETLAHMVLQGMERLGQLIILAQQQKPLENEQQESSEKQLSVSGGELGDMLGDQCEIVGEQSQDLKDNGTTLEGTQRTSKEPLEHNELSGIQEGTLGDQQTFTGEHL